MIRIEIALVLACWIMCTVGCGDATEVGRGGPDEAKQQQRIQQQVELLIKMAERPPEVDEPDRRKLAARALGKLGPAAQPAIPALEKLADDSDPEVKQAAEEALSKIRTQ